MKKIIALIILHIILIQTAVAEEESFGKKVGNLFKNWSITVGAAVLYQPEYQGSRDMKFTFIPIIAPVYRRFLFLTAMGGGVYFPIYKQYIMGSVAIGKDFFKISGERKINGLNDQEQGLILDTSLIFNFSKNYSATINAKKTFWGSDSLLIEGKATAKYEITEKLSVSLSGKASWGDKKYMRFKFGITPEESISSGFQAYEPGAALKSISADISIKYKIYKGLSATLLHSEGLLINAALSSPTTFRQRQGRTMFSLSYKFN